MKWLLDFEIPAASFDTLQVSGSMWETLDQKLAAAVMKICHDELLRKMALRAELEQKEARLAKGRQLLLMVYEHYKLNEELGAVYDINDLMAVTVRGGSKLEHFLITWDATLAGMKIPPGKTSTNPSFSTSSARARHSSKRSLTTTAPSGTTQTGTEATSSCTGHAKST